MALQYREFGQGDPLVILHGMFGFSDNWQTVAKALADHHTVITPDLRNHGRSPHFPTHSYVEMADDVRHLLEGKWVFRTALAGHSMGGKVAMHLAMHYPDLVQRLIVLDIAPGQASGNHDDIFKALNAIDFSVHTTREAVEDVMKPLIPQIGVRQFLLKNITRNAHGELIWKMNLPVISEYYDEILSPVSGDPFPNPTLFIRGERSDYIKDSDFALIQQLFPQSEVVTIPGAGHWVHAEQPQAVIDTMRKFLV